MFILPDFQSCPKLRFIVSLVSTKKFVDLGRYRGITFIYRILCVIVSSYANGQFRIGPEASC